MNHRTGLDRSQTLLLPERLEDYIAPENPVRFLDAFVASLGLAALGFAKARCARSVTIAPRAVRLARSNPNAPATGTTAPSPANRTKR
jgi:hypothetical protein